MVLFLLSCRVQKLFYFYPHNTVIYAAKQPLRPFTGVVGLFATLSLRYSVRSDNFYYFRNVALKKFTPPKFLAAFSPRFPLPFSFRPFVIGCFTGIGLNIAIFSAYVTFPLANKKPLHVEAKRLEHAIRIRAVF